MDRFLANVNEVITPIKEEFSFQLFERVFLGKIPKEEEEEDVRQKELIQKMEDVYNTYDICIEGLIKAQRIGTAESYRNSKFAFMRYRPKLTFQEVTPLFLYQFEQSLLDQGRSITTVGMYTRAMRVMVNIALENTIISQKEYPFGSKSKKKYEIPSGRNIKKALNPDDIKKIMNATDLPETVEYAKDMWLFSLYCNGSNLADMCFMKNNNIDGEFIRYFRRKTIRTQREKTPIEVYITPEIKDTLDKYRNKDKNPDSYLFGIINDTMSAEEKHRIKKNYIRHVNYGMKQLQKRLGIDVNLNSYVARHSFATLLKHAGANMSLISESLGHTNEKTTRNYLDSFSDETKKEVANTIRKILH